MKKTLLALALLSFISGCGWPEMNRDVVELRAIHATLRNNTKAKNPEDQGKVDLLGAKIDSILGHMEELTK